MLRSVLTIVLLLALAFTPISFRRAQMKVGSKKFTESVILGEMVAILADDAGTSAIHYRELGGTRLTYQALLQGDIDVYPEYTGTIIEEIFAGRDIETDEQLADALAEQGIRISRPLGFNNTYAVGMLASRADKLGLETTSDLTRRPDLIFGFSNEFLQRDDGWPNLKKFYGLPQTEVTGLDHDVAYRQLRSGAIDATDVYTTDAKIELFDLRVLEDDRGYFPRYDAVLLYRDDLAERHPEAVQSFLRLEGAIDEETMIALNGRCELERVSEVQVAGAFLSETFSIHQQAVEEGLATRVAKRTIEHLNLVRKSLIPAILLAIPLGVVAAKWPRLGHGILAGVGIIQTIPALALLVMLITPVSYFNLTGVGAGSVTAVLALFLYSLLPIVRSTYAGLHGIEGSHTESAAALGLPPWYRLKKVELPLAARNILAGVKTAAVINVGFATLGALIGAGGYGQPILTGIRLANNSLILEGAIPAAVLALLVQGLFDAVETFFVPRGLRIKAGE